MKKRVTKTKSKSKTTKVDIYFNGKYFGGALFAPLVKNMVVKYGGSYKKNKKNKKSNNVIITVEKKRKDLLVFMLEVRSGVVQKI